MNNKTLIVVAVLVVAVVAFLAGQYLAPSGGKMTKLNGPVAINSIITMDQNGACTQTVNGITTSFPVLHAKKSAFGGDTISWTGVDAGGNPAEVVVTFPQTNQKGLTGTPFSSGVNPVFVFKSRENSGPASGANLGDFFFQSVTVGGKPCSNPTAGGVHVDN